MPMFSASFPVLFSGVCLTASLLMACDTTPAALSASITSPASPTSTNGILTVNATVVGSPERVAVVLEPSGTYSTNCTGTGTAYTCTWNTASAAMQDYVLKIRATRGTQSADSAALTVRVDRQAPSVARACPGSSVSLADASIELEFNEALLPTSVGPNTVLLLQNGVQVGASVALSANNKTITVSPSALPALGSNMGLKLNGVSDTTGNTIINYTARTWTTAFWTLTCDRLDPLDSVALPNMRFGSDGVLTLAWIGQLQPTPRAVNVARLLGKTWNTLASKPNNENTVLGVDRSAMVLGQDNQPVVAYSQQDGLYVKRWDGSAWQALGGKLNTGSLLYATPNPVFEPSLETMNAQPVVAWVEANGLFVKRWDGTTWQPLGAKINTGVIAGWESPKLRVGSDGLPVVLWNELETAGGNSVRVARWDGNAWQALGAALNTAKASIRVSQALALDGNNNPVVAFLDNISNNEGDLVVRRYNGSTWDAASNKANTNPINQQAGYGLALGGNNQVYVGLLESNGFSATFFVRALQPNGTWSNVGPAIPGSASAVAAPALAVDANGVIWVATTESLGYIVVRRGR